MDAFVKDLEVRVSLPDPVCVHHDRARGNPHRYRVRRHDAFYFTIRTTGQPILADQEVAVLKEEDAVHCLMVIDLHVPDLQPHAPRELCGTAKFRLMKHIFPHADQIRKNERFLFPLRLRPVRNRVIRTIRIFREPALLLRASELIAGHCDPFRCHVIPSSGGIIHDSGKARKSKYRTSLSLL